VLRANDNGGTAFDLTLKGSTLMAEQGPNLTPGYVNPPCGASEVLPDDILAAIDLPVYVSTACEIALRLDEAAATHPAKAEHLRPWAERLHDRCRRNHKFTGVLCTCGHHGAAAG